MMALHAVIARLREAVQVAWGIGMALGCMHPYLHRRSGKLRLRLFRAFWQLSLKKARQNLHVKASSLDWFVDGLPRADDPHPRAIR
jgi:hypothetical protein